MIKVKRILVFLFKAGMLGGLLGAAVLAAAYLHFQPGLPAVESLRDIRLQTPLRIYTSDRKLIAEFGEKRRTPIAFKDIPRPFINAILAAEDSRFFEHPGIDVRGLTRAAWQLAVSGRIQSGGSTITMQVAKNYFLTREQTFIRKFREILLALQIEQELDKNTILELYVNKIYLGNRAYGVRAAASVYYGRPLEELSLAEYAMLAGLPKAPSANNPLANPRRALERRNWILERMRSLGMIDRQSHETATQAPITASYHSASIELNAPYVAEMARQALLERFGDGIYTDGYRAYTSIHSRDQRAARQALVNGVLSYDRRHGYRGPEGHFSDLESRQALLEALARVPDYANLDSAVVLEVAEQSASLLHESGEEITIDWPQMKWAWPQIDANNQGPKPETAEDILQAGDQVRVAQLSDGRWQLNQVPDLQSALVALSPRDGAIKALVGGFSYSLSKFNRAAQGRRQPGSNFKPFVYTAALAHGFTPATLINDAPVVFEDAQLESRWRPENYSGKFYGPTRLREALYRSRNLVSIRILRRLGLSTALDYVQRFGFPPEQLPKNLSLALGTASLTPLEVATGYAAFANQGFKVSPYLINRVTDTEGNVLFRAMPASVCEDCIRVRPGDPPPEQNDSTLSLRPIAPRIIDPQSAFLINSIMRDVIERGTGRRARSLKRSDIAGKTGTTNDQHDAWFSGFNPQMVASVWTGFDQPQTLGRREFGSTVALPIWIDFMETALKGLPEEPLTPPDGIVSVRIDPGTGLLAAPGQKDGVFEYFRRENVPQKRVELASPDRPEKLTPSELF